MTVEQMSVDELLRARRTFAKDATDEEWNLYLDDCRRYGVAPNEKKLHFQVRKVKNADGSWGRRYAPVTSIDYMREVAAATGELDGQELLWVAMDGKQVEVWLDPNAFPEAAIVKVYRKGCRMPFPGVANWAAFYPGDTQGAMWRKMPAVMLAKCAEALALRKAFPGQLQGLYDENEMKQASEPAPAMSRPKAA